MTNFTDVFGAYTVPPAEQGYSALALAADTTLEWPEFYSGTGSVVTAIIDVTPSVGSLSLTYPDATKVSTGRDCLIRNLGSFSFSVKDNAGNILATVLAGTAQYFYLTTNATAAGTWGVIAYGVGTSSVDAATLVGYGIKAITTTLNQSHPTTSTSGDITVDATYRAKVLIGTDTGTTTITLTTVATLGDNFFFMYRNSGSGTATLNPAGSELIDGQLTLEIQPGESLMLVSSGAAWYSVGYGRSLLYQFTQLVYDVTAGGPFTLSSSEASNKLITFIGTPGADVVVTVPQTVSVYYIYNNISTAHAVTVKTSAGVGVAVTQTARIIAICDGTYVVSAQSVTANTQISLVNGNVTNPALNFAASTNTGLYLNGASGLGIAIAGVAALLFDNSGNMTTTKTLNGLTITTTVGGVLTVASGKTLTVDANGDIPANSFLPGIRSQATAGGTTTLVVGDAQEQRFTGTLAQTCKLPVATTMTNGQTFTIINDSTGVVTVVTSGSNTLTTLSPATTVVVTCVDKTAGTGAASWSAAATSAGQMLGNAASKAIFWNSNTIAENITITSGQNGISKGPITISSGFTVTVNSGAVWGIQ